VAAHAVSCGPLSRNEQAMNATDQMRLILCMIPLNKEMFMPDTQYFRKRNGLHHAPWILLSEFVLGTYRKVIIGQPGL
jgi:hypothetical protein